MTNIISKAVICMLFSSLLVFTAPLSTAAGIQDLEFLTEEYIPYNYINHSGEADGISVRMLKEAYEQLGLVLDTNKIKTQPWPRAYRTARTAAKSVLLARKDHRINIQDKNDIKKYLVGGIRDDAAMQLVHTVVDDQGKLLTTPYAKSLVWMLALGRIDLWVSSEYMAKNLLSDHGFDPSDYEVVYTLKKSKAYYALSMDIPREIVAQFTSVRLSI